MNKRDATPEEEEAALIANFERWNRCNPSFTISLREWREKDLVAKQDGCKAEVCGCGVIFLAFHHFVDCRENNCPMRGNGGTLFEQWNEELEEQKND